MHSGQTGFHRTLASEYSSDEVAAGWLSPTASIAISIDFKNADNKMSRIFCLLEWVCRGIKFTLQVWSLRQNGVDTSMAAE